jgi:hypothetical protein
VYDSGYLNPAVLGLYASPDGSLSVDIDHAKWIIDGDKTQEDGDVAKMVGRGEIVAFGGLGIIEYDYDETTNKTTVYAVNPLNQEPAWDDAVLVPTEGGTTTLEWDNFVDPNHLSATVTATVYLGTDPEDPNFYKNKVIDAQPVTPGTRSSITSTTLIPTQDYYWEVEFDNGSGSTIKSPVSKFLVTDNAIPVVSIKNAYAWLDEVTGEVDVVMDAGVTNDVDESVTYSWTLGAADPSAAFVDATVEDATLRINSTGERTVILTVNDGVWPDQSGSGVVSVASNACEAARLTPDYPGDPAGDITGDCVADLEDLADLAQTWLYDTTLTETSYYLLD